MTYQYYSAKFDSEVQVSYNRNGILSGFQVMRPDVNELKSRDQCFSNYFQERDFLAEAKKHSLKLVKVEREVSFDEFWETYKQKDCGRTKAEQIWNKMSKADQVEAFDFIPGLNGILKNNGTAKPYATTYLNQRRWIR